MLFITFILLILVYGFVPMSEFILKFVGKSKIVALIFLLRSKISDGIGIFSLLAKILSASIESGFFGVGFIAGNIPSSFSQSVLLMVSLLDHPLFFVFLLLHQILFLKIW